MASEIAISPGDVLVRDGVVPVGYGRFTARIGALSVIIGENYNHAGVAISGFEVHHVESNGYEDVPITRFFDCKNAKSGAVIRFAGPEDLRIRKRVGDIAQHRRYKLIPGNPFSTAFNSDTVNCNEFVYSLYKLAIAELTAEAKPTNPRLYSTLTNFYSNRALIKPRTIEFTFPSGGASIASSVLEKVGATQANNPNVQIKFEGQTFCGKSYFDLICAYSKATLTTYTPDSFLRSPFFQVVGKRKCGAR
jgi:hypothetical protein